MRVSAGQAGVCVDVNMRGCDQATLGGFCAGRSNIRCCPSGASTGYARATASLTCTTPTQKAATLVAFGNQYRPAEGGMGLMIPSDVEELSVRVAFNGTDEIAVLNNAEQSAAAAAAAAKKDARALNRQADDAVESGCRFSRISPQSGWTACVCDATPADAGAGAGAGANSGSETPHKCVGPRCHRQHFPEIGASIEFWVQGDCPTCVCTNAPGLVAAGSQFTVGMDDAGDAAASDGSSGDGATGGIVVAVLLLCAAIVATVYTVQARSRRSGGASMYAPREQPSLGLIMNQIRDWGSDAGQSQSNAANASADEAQAPHFPARHHRAHARATKTVSVHSGGTLYAIPIALGSGSVRTLVVGPAGKVHPTTSDI